MADGVVCPKCGGAEFAPVKWSLWGGVLGPKLLHHVKCTKCGAKFNGKTGKDNFTAIVIYTVVGCAIGLVIGILILVAIAS